MAASPPTNQATEEWIKHIAMKEGGGTREREGKGGKEGGESCGKEKVTSVLRLGFSVASDVDKISCSTRGTSVHSLHHALRHDIAAALN